MFECCDNWPTESTPTAHVVRVRQGCCKKRRLLQSLARQLQFPPYFGENWDALTDCLRDLSWWGDTPEILIRHADLPFSPGSQQRHIYLSILAEVLLDREGVTPRLRVGFPASDQPAIAALLAPPR